VEADFYSECRMKRFSELQCSGRSLLTWLTGYLAIHYPHLDIVMLAGRMHEDGFGRSTGVEFRPECLLKRFRAPQRS
jgi:hypothetical protein